MAVFIALVAPTMRTRPAAALELTGNKSFLQEILPYYILFVKDFWREAGEEMLLAAAAVCVLKTLQIFFDTSIMKFFFESKSASPHSVAAELCAIPHRLLLISLSFFILPMWFHSWMQSQTNSWTNFFLLLLRCREICILKTTRHLIIRLDPICKMRMIVYFGSIPILFCCILY